ncbi:MAG: transglycosylase SLT domain-containing protein [Opitutales bacterium]
MPLDHHYHRDERLVIRLAVVLAIVVGIIAIYLATSLGTRVERVAPEEVWSYIQKLSERNELDPEFVYALAWAESSLNAKARSPVARGMMQITKPAWREVSEESYRFAWDWKVNLRVGTDYLVFCREFLRRHDSFSYPLLAASYRYGPYYVKEREFEIDKLRVPQNEIYKRIFDGVIRPVPPPSMPTVSVQR